MHLVQLDAELCSKEMGRPQIGGIMVNPDNKKVVACSYKTLVRARENKGDGVKDYPFHTPTLLCIEGTSAIVRGDIENDGILPDDSYLCTGLDLYLTEEPDLFSAMALVHSRIRRVIYATPCPGQGALGSLYNIHELRSLNHHFRVYVHKKSPDH
jgi:tRNA-specific adenosine deaminase 3